MRFQPVGYNIVHLFVFSFKGYCVSQERRAEREGNDRTRHDGGGEQAGAKYSAGAGLGWAGLGRLCNWNHGKG